MEGVERETKKAVKEAVGKVTKDVKKRVNKEVDKAKKRAEEEWEKVQKSIPGLPDSDAGGDKVKADLEKSTAGGGLLMKIVLGVAALALIGGIIAVVRR